MDKRNWNRDTDSEGSTVRKPMLGALLALTLIPHPRQLGRGPRGWSSLPSLTHAAPLPHPLRLAPS
jgi:hypothetical protein